MQTALPLEMLWGSYYPKKGNTGGGEMLFAASVLSFCLQLAGAQSVTMTIKITVNPPKLIDGGSVTLTPSSLPENTFICRWYRGTVSIDAIIISKYFPPLTGQKEGPKYTGRETVNSDGSLHITNLNINDSGIYTVNMDSPMGIESGEMNIVVSDSPLPYDHGGSPAGIVLGTLAVMGLLGALLYFFLWIHRRRKKETSPPLPSELLIYENVPPLGPVKTAENPGTSSDLTTHIYETLQSRSPQLYDVLKLS